MNQHHISVVAHLIAEPVRAAMLISLSGGGALSASALADVAGITAQTASFHLAKLLDGGLLTVASRGRNRYYQLAGSHIAQLLESLASIGPVTNAWKTTPSQSAKALRFARCCYDHLAGQVGVALTQGMLQKGWLVENEGANYALTDGGRRWLASLGVAQDNSEAEQAHRCLDWTERQYHIAGPLGATLMSALMQWEWVTKPASGRALTVTPQGWKALAEHFAITPENLC
jgi:DNA-binding transcriptional ArsR family regulator